MKLVIDIPEELYNAYKGRPPCLGDEGMDMIAQSIATGTPLPEGHGRLIDADAIKPIKVPIAPLTPEDTVHYEWVYMKSWIDQTLSIIEADKGEAE